MNYSGMPKNNSADGFFHEAPSGIYYHYTSLSTFWAIIESDNLHATNARFSNDSEEIKLGIRLIKRIIKESQNIDPNIKENISTTFNHSEDDYDNYIICFCEKPDRLSQWRGYCRSDGVSIGFEYNNETQKIFYGESYSENEQHVKLFKVNYIDGDDESSYIKIKDYIDNYFNKDGKNKDNQVNKTFLSNMIPLIKNIFFEEETEYRIVLSNSQTTAGEDNRFPLDKFVKYKDNNGIRCPYIPVNFGKIEKFDRDSAAVIPVGIKIFGSKSEKINQLKMYINSVDSILIDSTKYKIDFHFSLTECKDTYIVIEAMEDIIQKSIFKRIDTIVEHNDINAKIWCEGHLPIRKIIVSPCENQKDVAQAIKHYCLHGKYWLKYVEVTSSKIPFRRPK